MRGCGTIFSGSNDDRSLFKGDDMEKFLEVYQQLNSTNLQLLRSVYAENVRFEDPVHEINGLDNLIRYFEGMYADIESIRFDFGKQIVNGDEACVQWDMHFRHKKLRSGGAITVPGMSYIVFDNDNKVCEHRDYFDLGSMLYEHIPVLGLMVGAVKRRMAK